MSWMQSNVVTRSSEPSAGSGSIARIGKAAFVRPALGQPLAGPGERVLGDVVADERARRERLGQQQHRAPAPQPTSATRAPAASLLDHAVQGRQHVGQQVGAVPRLEAALDADRPLRTVAVVVVPDAGAEALGQLLERAIVWGRRWNIPIPNAS